MVLLLFFYSPTSWGGGGANALIAPSLDQPLSSPHPSRAGGVTPQHAHEGITQRGGEDSGHYTAHREQTDLVLPSDSLTASIVLYDN